MKNSLKWILVLGGYLAAFLAALLGAFLISWLRQAGFPGLAAASQGMSAFGDLVFFLAIWAFLSLFPTALALYFLFRNFWR